MNIPSIPAAGGIAGTQLAAAKGGQSDAKSAEATARQSISDTPAGKASDSAAVDAGEQAGDRHGDGRQQLDTFQTNHEEEAAPNNDEAANKEQNTESDADDEPPAHLDLTI